MLYTILNNFEKKKNVVQKKKKKKKKKKKGVRSNICRILHYYHPFET